MIRLRKPSGKRKPAPCTAAIDAWTGVDNAPAVRHGREPVRASWAAIVAFVDRMAREAGGSRLLPDAPTQRAEVMGALNEIAGEEGVGWNARLAMVEAGLSSDRQSGFPTPVAKFLGKRYGHRPDAVAVAG